MLLTSMHGLAESRAAAGFCGADDAKRRLEERQMGKFKLGPALAVSLGSLHSMDSANACGALGRGFESLRARHSISAGQSLRLMQRVTCRAHASLRFCFRSLI